MRLLGLFCVSCIAAAVCFPNVASAQRPVDIRHAVTRDAAIRVGGSFAELRVIAWQFDSVALSGTIPKGARLEGGVRNPSAPSAGAKFWIEPVETNPGVGSLVLRVPPGARIWVKTDNATITCDGVTGDIDLNIIAGSLVVNGNPANANLESMDGTVTVNGSPRWLRIKTADGDVSLRGSSEDVAITTISGQILVRDGDFERARFQSVTGAVTFAGNLVRGADLSIDTHSGAVDFSSRIKASLSIDARTLTGRIENTMNAKRPSPGRDGRGEELTLELGNGGARALLRSFKAGIRLTSR